MLLKALNDELGPATRGRREVVDGRALLLTVKRFQALESVLSNRDIPLFSLAPDQSMDPNPEVMRKFAAINRFLRRYEAYPRIIPEFYTDANPLSRGLLFHWGRVGPHQQPFFEVGLVQDIVKLYQAGRISSLKQCDQCRRWLFARFPHQRFCGAVCKEAFHRSNETDKKRRREWARNNYWLHKNKNVK